MYARKNELEATADVQNKKDFVVEGSCERRLRRLMLELMLIVVPCALVWPPDGAAEGAARARWSAPAAFLPLAASRMGTC